MYLGHGIFRPVAVLVFLQISFWEVLSSQIEKHLWKKKCTYVVARLCPQLMNSDKSSDTYGPKQ